MICNTKLMKVALVILYSTSVLSQVEKTDTVNSTDTNASDNTTLLANEWLLFKRCNDKSYLTLEDNYRFNLFQATKDVVSKHNAKFEAGEVSYKIGMNHLADKTPAEVNSLMTGFIKPEDDQEVEYVMEAGPVNSSVDWRKLGAVTRVKDQTVCGSCWAFSAIGAVESLHYIKTGVLTSYSEQELIDCSSDYGNFGCIGGEMTLAYNYVKKEGISPERDWPYVAEEGYCPTSSKNRGFTISGYRNVPSGDENQLMKNVYRAPLSVGIDAGSRNFHLYQSGVYDNPACSSTKLNHAVVLVGYGTTPEGKDYWLIKNSWGSLWGENGFMRMKRNGNNLCGIATCASYPF